MVKLYEVFLGRIGRTGAVALVTVLFSAGSAVAAGGGGATAAGSGSSSAAGQSGSSSGGAGMSGSGHTASASSPFGTQTLRQGMSGSQVRLLQDYLDVAGFKAGANGSFGPGTKKSVMNFQRSWGLSPTGVIRQADGRALAGKVEEIDSVKPSGRTRINQDGTAAAASNAPAVVQWMIAGANHIIDSSYCVGGGHGQWKSSCYDCSGAVSYVLHAGYMLSESEDSSSFENYGQPGKGKWVTIYTSPSHAFIVIDGRAFDTADFGGPNRPSGDGPRWRSNPTGNFADGNHYVARHPPGL